MYIDTMYGEDDDLHYLRWFIVLNKDNDLIYTNRPRLSLPKPIFMFASEKISVAGEKWYLSYSWGKQHKIKVFIGESVEDGGMSLVTLFPVLLLPFLFIL